MAKISTLPTFTCKFENYLDEALHDRLVCGRRDTSAQKKLLVKKALTFQEVVEATYNFE